LLKPTNDPIASYRRATEEAARAVRESARAGGTQSFQAVRKLEAQIDEVRDLLIRMPWSEGRQVDVSSWSISGAWTTIAQAVIPRPADKTRVVVSASGSATAIGSGDLLAFSSRIVVNGVASIAMQGLPEGSGAITRCSVFPSFVREISGLTTAVTVALQLNLAANPFEFDKRASLSVSAGFSVV
jgi:hypothetical protein